jgi:DeoR family suf operon transcriptional repressor
MQETRQHILEILYEKKQATVDDIVEELFNKQGNITAVTVRHHLNLLQRDGLITEPKLLHRNVPGRPQYIYALTEKGENRFPNNYKNLAKALLHRIETTLPAEEINVIMEGVASDLAENVQVAEKALEIRLDAAVNYLNEHGYDANISTTEGGYLIQTQTCPYSDIKTDSQNLCNMDLRLLASIIGIVPRMVSRISDGDQQCCYFIPTSQLASQ